ncbi:MAG: acyl carrier protein [Planktothrix agardhii LY1]|jgi:acyl carrier protein|uniref:acyl carrier protein n=1 Tax=Planktothrix agardhii TaxID=1160 RepID=UPI002430051D|nr:acyl carrier protein [Planktothrix agardhii]MCP9296742.1 acyl carrier protein [Planktothrix agardhii LY1]
MEERIKKVMGDVLDVDQSSLNEDSSPDNIENWDSVRHMNLILALEDEFGVQFDQEQITQMLNFQLIKLNLDELMQKTDK